MNSSRERWDSCIEAGRRAYEKGCYSEADQILTHTFEKLMSESRQSDMIFVDLLIAYAQVKRERDQFGDALSLYYRALSALRNKEKGDRALSVRILQEIALCLCLVGKFEQAREKEKRVLSSLDELFGVVSLLADECVVRLACLSWIMGDIDSSSVYLDRHRMHCIRQQELKGQAMVAPTSLLAQAHYRMGNFAMAERYFRDSREFFKETETPEKELAVLGNELGMSICAQGRCEEARILCQESANLRGKCASRCNSVDKADTINDLADVYCAKGDFSSAKQLCESAESLRWDVPEKSHAAKLALYSRLLKRLGQSTFTGRLDRRARELAQAA